MLIADDSVVYRSQMRLALEGHPRIEVAGAAPHGRVALERMTQSPVQLLILDLEMPEMDGVATLRELQARGDQTKVLVFSSHSRRGAESSLEAMRLGACDFISKPTSEDMAAGGSPLEILRQRLIPRIEALFPLPQAKVIPLGTSFPRVTSVQWSLLRPKVILIGSSTGGPTALEKIFAQLRAPLSCPVLIVQHMPPVFTATLAERLQKISGLTVREALHGEPLRDDQVYIAPGNFHLKVAGTALAPVLALDQGPQVNSVRPAVDHLFATAAALFGDRVLAFVLTGMGADGRDGCAALKSVGGTVVIQDEASCVVFGMPGAVLAAGLQDRIATPDEIAAIIMDKAGGLAPVRQGGGHG